MTPVEYGEVDFAKAVSIEAVYDEGTLGDTFDEEEMGSSVRAFVTTDQPTTTYN